MLLARRFTIALASNSISRAINWRFWPKIRPYLRAPTFGSTKNYFIYYIFSFYKTSNIRAFTMGMLNAICCIYLAFVSKKSPPSGIEKVKNCKKKFNTAIVPSYFYDGTVDYWICFLIYFILSLSFMSGFLNSLSFLISSPFLSVNCSQLSLSLSLCWWLGLHAGVWVVG